MPKIIEYCSRASGYMCAADLPEGKDGVVCAIGDYKKAKLRGGDDKIERSRPALMLVDMANKAKFRDCDGTALWMPVNNGNRDVLIDLLSTDELDDMVGRVITIYQAVGMAFGKQTAMIKVKKSLPPQDKGPQRKGTKPPATAPKNATPASATTPPSAGPAADRPPIDTNNDASQTYLPEEPPQAP